jgi:hypothetical protein
MRLCIKNVDEIVDIAQRHSGHKLKEACSLWHHCLRGILPKHAQSPKDPILLFLTAVFGRIN